MSNQLPINLEGFASLGLSYAASVIPNSTISKSYESVSDVVVTAKFPRNYVPEVTVPAAGGAGVMIRGPNERNGADPTFVPQRGDPTDYGDYGQHNIQFCLDPEAVTMWNTVVKSTSDWTGHFFTLLGSSENNDLTPVHFKSYFAWHRTAGIEGEVLAKHFPKITGGMKTFLHSPAARGMMKEGKWVTYRTTFSSGGLLLAKMMRECPDKYLGVFSAATKALVQDYAIDPWSETKYRAIPEKALGIMYAYLKATDQLVEDLWGPKRHYEDLSVQEKESLKVWFAEAKSELKVYVKGIAGVGSVDMPKGVWDV